MTDKGTEVLPVSISEPNSEFCISPASDIVDDGGHGGQGDPADHEPSPLTRTGHLGMVGQISPRKALGPMEREALKQKCLRAKLAKVEYLKQKKERALQERQFQEAAQWKERKLLVAGVEANLEAWKAEALEMNQKVQQDEDRRLHECRMKAQQAKLQQQDCFRRQAALAEVASIPQNPKPGASWAAMLAAQQEEIAKEEARLEKAAAEAAEKLAEEQRQVAEKAEERRRAEEEQKRREEEQATQKAKKLRAEQQRLEEEQRKTFEEAHRRERLRRMVEEQERRQERNTAANPHGDAPAQLQAKELAATTKAPFSIFADSTRPPPLASPALLSAKHSHGSSNSSSMLSPACSSVQGDTPTSAPSLRPALLPRMDAPPVLPPAPPLVNGMKEPSSPSLHMAPGGPITSLPFDQPPPYTEKPLSCDKGLARQSSLSVDAEVPFGAGRAPTSAGQVQDVLHPASSRPLIAPLVRLETAGRQKPAVRHLTENGGLPPASPPSYRGAPCATGGSPLEQKAEPRRGSDDWSGGDACLEPPRKRGRSSHSQTRSSSRSRTRSSSRKRSRNRGREERFRSGSRSHYRRSSTSHGSRR
eukprot:GGOE01044720.1.p1 GENE.GGOE01044720.1~~GGOE01044720.1.p1  ORF type:complete len:589 (-),score=104.07 GGOE01044720.1:76-1842(-)